jgi:hypothetical protein
MQTLISLEHSIRKIRLSFRMGNVCLTIYDLLV